jgi:hypothetical protein
MKKNTTLTAALLVAVFYLFTACPGPDPGPGIEPPPPQNNFTISLEDMANGTIEAPRVAIMGASITITVRPNTGYVAETVRVREDPLNHDIPRTAGANNTWTFIMPASNVRVGATFRSDSDSTLHNIVFTHMSNGTVEGPLRAAAGETIEIRAYPDSGHLLRDIRVRDDNNRIITLDPETEENTWTFTMPASNALISATFHTVSAALESTVNSLTTGSSWDEISDANALIVRVQDSLGIGRQTVAPDIEAALNAAILHLVGSGTDQTTDNIGVIRRKMRNEDLTTWLPLNAWPSYPIDRGRETYMNDDRTHLYFVREDNPVLPNLVLRSGWREGTRTPNYIEEPVGAAYAGVIRVPLIFDVGKDHSIRYFLLLCPVAQYTIQYTGGVSGTVRIEEITNPDKGLRSRILNASTPNRIGEVGRHTPGALFPDPVYSIEGHMNITGTGVFTMTNSDGYVQDLDGVHIRNRDTLTKFFPESRRYTITVSPPPSP